MNHQHRKSFPYFLVTAIVFSLISPMLMCFLVITSLVGIENIKQNYWIIDGIVISSALNTATFAPLLFPAVRRFAFGYSIIAATVVTLLAFVGYGYWMVALTGV